jgi:hypothetical protein
MKKYYKENRKRGVSYKQQKERSLHFIGNILRGNVLLKQVIEGRGEESVEVTGRRERRRKQLPDNHKKKRVYWK